MQNDHPQRVLVRVGGSILPATLWHQTDNLLVVTRLWSISEVIIFQRMAPHTLSVECAVLEDPEEPDILPQLTAAPVQTTITSSLHWAVFPWLPHEEPVMYCCSTICWVCIAHSCIAFSAALVYRAQFLEPPLMASPPRACFLTTLLMVAITTEKRVSGFCRRGCLPSNYHNTNNYICLEKYSNTCLHYSQPNYFLWHMKTCTCYLIMANNMTTKETFLCICGPFSNIHVYATTNIVPSFIWLCCMKLVTSC